MSLAGQDRYLDAPNLCDVQSMHIANFVFALETLGRVCVTRKGAVRLRNQSALYAELA